MRLLTLFVVLSVPLVSRAQDDLSAKLDTILNKVESVQKRTVTLAERVGNLETASLTRPYEPDRSPRSVAPPPYLRQPVRWPIYYGSPQSGWVLVGYSDTLPDGLGPINSEAAELTRRYLTNYRSVGTVERSGYSPPKLGLQPPGSPDYLPDH